MLYWLTGEELTAYQSESLDPRLKSFCLAQAEPQPVMIAEQLMSTPALFADSKWSLEYALAFMQEHSISHLPVLTGERLVGLVSDRDILRRPEKAKSPVKEVMSNRLLTARPDSNLWLVAKIMQAERVNCVVIVDAEGNLQGILTSLDLLGCMTHHAPIEVWM